MKKVALTHSWRSAVSTASVVPGQGPSSKVSTTSLGCSGSVARKCLRPTAGVVAGSTARTRAVPSAAGLPEQSAAPAAGGTRDSNGAPGAGNLKVGGLNSPGRGDETRANPKAKPAATKC